jgi:hypothetical protein
MDHVSEPLTVTSEPTLRPVCDMYLVFFSVQAGVFRGFPTTIPYTFHKSHIHVGIRNVCDQSMTGSLSAVP